MNIRHRFIFQAPADGDPPPGGAPPAPPPPPGSPPPPPAPPSIAWLPGADEETVGFVQNKAWTGPADVLTGYRNIEKMLGADRAGRTVVLPTEDTPEAWAQVYDKLGRPTTPDGYKLASTPGADPVFSKAAEAKFHELGITAKQAEGLNKWYAETGGAMTAAQQAQEDAALEAEHAALRKDWGSEHDARREVARRAAVHLGLDEKAIDAMEKSSGYAKTLKALAKVGDLLAEHGAEGISTPGSFGMTPEGAKARKSQLMADKEWGKRAMNPASAEWAELKKLDTIIAGAMQG